jgi:NAD(P)H-hydrate repair Nnr-like enzyme with NAD(P)H-hydrate dehydratase domain
LASAGTGDVLAGWLGGLWAAQPACPPGTVAAAGVWLHGLAGESGDQRLPLLAGDLIVAMARVVAETAWRAPGGTPAPT